MGGDLALIHQVGVSAKFGDTPTLFSRKSIK